MLGRNPRALLQFVPGALLGFLFSATPLARLRLPSFLCTVLGVSRHLHACMPSAFGLSLTAFVFPQQVFHPLFDVVPASAVALQRQRRVMEAQRRLGVRNNQQNMVAGQGFRDQLLPGAGGAMGGGGGGAMLPPHMAATPPSEDAIQQLMVRARCLSISNTNMLIQTGVPCDMITGVRI